jgi:hypothetical protein
MRPQAWPPGAPTQTPGAHLPQQVLPLHPDVQQVPQAGAAAAVCRPRKQRVPQHRGPLGILAHPLPLQRPLQPHDCLWVNQHRFCQQVC